MLVEQFAEGAKAATPSCLAGTLFCGVPMPRGRANQAGPPRRNLSMAQVAEHCPPPTTVKGWRRMAASHGVAKREMELLEQIL